jgi:uroporphyrinogen decarboxylase
MAEVYPIDLIDLHDDWGTQISSFMPVETWKQLLSEPIGRIAKHCKDKGIHAQMHSCGKIEAIVPEMVNAGGGALVFLPGYERHKESGAPFW